MAWPKSYLGFAAQISSGLASFELHLAYLALSCRCEGRANQARVSERVKKVRESYIRGGFRNKCEWLYIS